MSVATIRASDVGTVHIGPAHHRRRNLWIAFGLVVTAGVMAGYSSYVVRSDGVALEQLEQLRATYATQCDVPSFFVTPPAFKDIYLRSSTLQAAVAQQLGALRSGRSCDDVAQALRAVDFPMPAVPRPEPSVTLDPPTQ